MVSDDVTAASLHPAVKAHDHEVSERLNSVVATPPSLSVRADLYDWVNIVGYLVRCFAIFINRDLLRQDQHSLQ